MSLRRPALLLAAVVLASGCAAGGFVASWKAPDAVPLEVSGAKVAAIVMMTDEASRRTAEDTLVRELNARGAMGVAMYSIMPDAEPSDEAEVRDALEAQGFEGVVVMRPFDTTQEVVSSRAAFREPYYGGFWGGYYLYGWSSPWSLSMYGPVDVRTNTIVSVETLVYSLRQNKLVWGGKSETTNPPNIGRLIEDTARRAARELHRQGLLPG